MAFTILLPAFPAFVVVSAEVCAEFKSEFVDRTAW